MALAVVSLVIRVGGRWIILVLDMFKLIMFVVRFLTRIWMLLLMLQYVLLEDEKIFSLVHPGTGDFHNSDAIRYSAPIVNKSMWGVMMLTRELTTPQF